MDKTHGQWLGASEGEQTGAGRKRLMLTAYNTTLVINVKGKF
jgi:hypothetical protein